MSLKFKIINWKIYKNDKNRIILPLIGFSISPTTKYYTSQLEICPVSLSDRIPFLEVRPKHVRLTNGSACPPPSIDSRLTRPKLKRRPALFLDSAPTSTNAAYQTPAAPGRCAPTSRAVTIASVPTGTPGTRTAPGVATWTSVRGRRAARTRRATTATAVSDARVRQVSLATRSTLAKVRSCTPRPKDGRFNNMPPPPPPPLKPSRVCRPPTEFPLRTVREVKISKIKTQ